MGVSGVAKVDRKAAVYLEDQRLPDADPTSDTPLESKPSQVRNQLTKKLLEPVGTDDGYALPDARDRLFDTMAYRDLAHARPEGDSRSLGGSPFTILAEGRNLDTAYSPAAVIRKDQVRLNEVWSDIIEDDDSDSITATLRKVALELERRGAEDKPPAEDPVFKRSHAAGVSSDDYPLPGSSFAIFGARLGWGRQRVTAATIETDQLFRSREDAKRSGTPRLKHAPNTAEKAGEMKPGDRWKLTVDRAILSERSAKYTLTPFGPLGFATSTGFHDLGPSLGAEFISAVEGEVAVEIVRGFGTKVALCVTAADHRVMERDERTEKDDSGELGDRPGRDRNWQFKIGAYIDGSVPETVVKGALGDASKYAERHLESLEDQRRKIEQRIMPHTEKFNHYGALTAGRDKKQSQSAITMYGVVFDLANPEARKIYNEVAGAPGRGMRGIDFSSLQRLDPESGVEVVVNNVELASRTAIEKTFNAFGLRVRDSGTRTETSEGREGPPGAGKRIYKEKHGVTRRWGHLGRSADSVAVGRVKTTTDEVSGDASTAVGLGWRFGVEDAHTSVDDLESMAAFAAIAREADGDAQRLRAVRRKAEELPRKKILGLPIGKRELGKTSVRFAVELNAAAVERLLAHDDAELLAEMASAHARASGDEEIPGWSETGGPGAARNVIEQLRSARSQPPSKRAETLATMLSDLRKELPLAAALIRAARGEDGKGVDVWFDVTGAEALEEAASPEGAVSVAEPELDQDVLVMEIGGDRIVLPADVADVGPALERPDGSTRPLREEELRQARARIRPNDDNVELRSRLDAAIGFLRGKSDAVRFADVKARSDSTFDKWTGLTASVAPEDPNDLPDSIQATLQRLGERATDDWHRFSTGAPPDVTFSSDPPAAFFDSVNHAVAYRIEVGDEEAIAVFQPPVGHEDAELMLFDASANLVGHARQGVTADRWDWSAPPRPATTP